MLLSSKLELEHTAPSVSKPRFMACSYMVSDLVIQLGCLFFFSLNLYFTQSASWPTVDSTILQMIIA